MTYFSTTTSKGTISIPAQVRKQLGIKPGMLLQFRVNAKTGNAEIIKPLDINEVRKRNREILKDNGFTDDKLREMAREYQNGDGMTAHVLEKYGLKNDSQL